jgi:hypothetical protein
VLNNNSPLLLASFTAGPAALTHLYQSPLARRPRLIATSVFSWSTMVTRLVDLGMLRVTGVAS